MLKKNHGFMLHAGWAALLIPLVATAFLGFRPWMGGERYFDPELAQGEASI